MLKNLWTLCEQAVKNRTTTRHWPIFATAPLHSIKCNEQGHKNENVNLVSQKTNQKELNEEEVGTTNYFILQKKIDGKWETPAYPWRA